MGQLQLVALAGGVQDTIASGFLPWAMALAFAGGVVSFASPCVLPLVPGFLGYITGLGGVQGERDGQGVRTQRPRLVLASVLFVLGFSAVFLALSVVVSGVSIALSDDRALLMRLGGLAVLVMGAVMAFGLGGREWKVRWRPAAGLAGAPLLGGAFGLGFSACIGPVLGAILALSTSLSGSTDAITRGAVLAGAYSLGLGLPFVLLAAGISRLAGAFGWLRDHHRIISIIGGAVLMVLGVLMVAGVWDRAMVWLQTEWISSFRPVI
ncbi:cytochrome c biogenesis CcdA family protein [Kytococcus sedentarius]|uniref:cytochrome c biogenesis CcdA family protein n=1 Tax=Kytococcus sedentarius TaxID=1276 RepID=UPI0035BC812C